MNRNQEYLDFIQTLDAATPSMRSSIQKARQRNARLTLVYRPLASAAAFLAVFVLLVNFSAPAARAFAQVPLLRELAAAVTFSRSLTDAVEHAYVQPIGLTETQNGITAEIAHVIVDEKQVNVFYTLNSDQYRQLEADPTVLTSGGERPQSCMYSSSAFGTPNGELRCLTIDFGDGDVPGALRIQLSLYNNEQDSARQMPKQNARDGAMPMSEKAYLAQFDFLVEFDVQQLAKGEIIAANRAVEMDGQTITITQIEVYPTHIQVKVEEDPGNTAWLTGLEFYIETDQGMKFEPVSNGITATGTENTPSMVSYRADSTYFYGAKHLSVVITGAQWLRKDMDTAHVNLLTGETGTLPEGVAFESAEKNGAGWTVTFRVNSKEDAPMHAAFRHTFYDAHGTAYELSALSYTHGEPDEQGSAAHFLNQFFLRDYPYDEVWLCPQFSHTWTANDALVIPVR